MQVLRDLTAIDRVPDPEVRGLIELRIRELSEFSNDVFADLLFFVVVEQGDSIGDVDSVLGFSILSNRFDGTRFGDRGFTPSWDVLAEFDRCYELVYVLGDDGCGVTVLVTKAGGVSACLLAMCREYAPSEAST